MLKAHIQLFADGRNADYPTSRRNYYANILLILFFFAFFAAIAALSANAEVAAVTLQSPQLSPGGTTNLVSPVHLQATAEDTATITGYVVYVDGQNVYSNFSPSADAWIALSPGQHVLYVTASDAHGTLSTPSYQINVTAFAPPTPPLHAHRLLNIDAGAWTVDNNPGVGGNCNDGSLGPFTSTSDPNTKNLPVPGSTGQHFILTSACQYDDSLFYWKYAKNQSAYAGDTNFLWDFWFYIPTTTQSSTVQALEFDLFQAVQLSDGVHEFMFGSQCDYPTNQWQFWLPQRNNLGWVSVGTSPCQFSTGQWHHVTYFLQRVTPSGYQEIPKTFSPSTDKNSSLRFGTLTIDGQTMYLGGVSWSTIPNPPWSPVIGVQHQLDSAVAGVVIEQYADGESLTSW